MQCILGSQVGKFTLVIFDHSSVDRSCVGDKKNSSFSLIFEYFFFNDHKESNFVVSKEE